MYYEIVHEKAKEVKENEIILNFIDHYYGHLGITPVKRFSVTGVDKLDDLLKQENVIDEIYNYVINIA